MSASSSIGHRPSEGQRWTFDAGVTAVFSDMLRRSIPNYEAMRDAVDRLARRYVAWGTDVVDLGASRGEGVARLVEEFAGDAVRFRLVETSPPMLDALRERFAGVDCVSVESMDLRTDYPVVHASLTLAILTLQFVPIEHRQRVLLRAFESTRPGGALIVVEKVLGPTSALHDAFVEEYHDLKVANGYAPEDVAAKARSLEGSLVPVSAAENERMLRAAGFSEVECFWRWLNFAGWIAVK